MIATTESPLPELLDGGGLFVPPREPVALTGAMRALLTDPCRRQAMGLRARARAQELSWARGASSALDALHEAAA